MGYSPQGHKGSDVTEQLNDNNHAAHIGHRAAPALSVLTPNPVLLPLCHPLLFSEAGVMQNATEPRSPDPSR